jgi:dissimilatory sulfite reductase (desulfoviridin) alpha/beta subunit
MLNRYTDQLTVNLEVDDIDRVTAELKMRIWDRAIRLSKERNVELSEDLIEEVVNSISNVKDFLFDLEPSLQNWYLNQIVDGGICCKCGVCSLICPSNLIKFTNRPVLHKECAKMGNGLCKELCSRVSSGRYQIKSRLNLNPEYYSAKGNVQYIIQQFVNYLIKMGKIDGAIIIGGDNWKPLSLIVKKIDKDTKFPLSKYTIGTLEALKEAYNQGIKKVALVTLPCQIGSLRKLEFLPYLTNNINELLAGTDVVDLPKIEYFIGEFCSEKYDYNSLNKILNENNINVQDIEKFTLKDGNLHVETENDYKVINIKRTAIEPGCKLCKDYTSELADVSIGSSGTASGESTIIIRTEKGEEIKNIINLEKNLNLSVLEDKKARKLERFNKEKVRREIENEPNTYYWFSDYPGVLKTNNGTYNIRTRGKSNGIYDIQYAKNLVSICEKYDCNLKLTTRSSFEINNVKPNDVDNIIKDLEFYDINLGSTGPVSRTVLSCQGNLGCKSALVDTTVISEEIEEKFGQIPTPSKFDISISGCPNNCVRSQISDFGVQGYQTPKIDVDVCNGCEKCIDLCPVSAIHGRRGITYTNNTLCIGCGLCIKICPTEARTVNETGYVLYIGGKSGKEILPGIPVKVGSKKEVLNKLSSLIKAYNNFALSSKKERLHDTIQRVGVVHFLDEMNKESDE